MKQMMQTEELIKSLTAGLQPTAPQALQRLLLQAILFGAVGTLVIFAIVYRPRADIATAIRDWPTMMKLAYALSMALCAWLLCEKLARPGVSVKQLLWLPVIPALLLGGVALNTALQAPADLRHWLLFGHSALYCPFNIALLSLPIFVMLVRSLRRAAPTQLRLSAAIAGLVSGAVATLFYSLYCTESSVQFVAAWYTLGMLLPAAYGALFGHRLLHWR